jgi:hypothetical protein
LKREIKSNQSPSSSSQENEKNKKGKQTKKYTSDGKPIYEEK